MTGLGLALFFCASVAAGALGSELVRRPRLGVRIWAAVALTFLVGIVGGLLYAGWRP